MKYFTRPILSTLSSITALRILILLLLPCPQTHAAPIAEGNPKFLGNITGSRATPSNFLSYWNQVTPENSGKWASVERTRDVMDWRWLDSTYAFSRKNKIPMKLHTLIWGNQTPSWVSRLTAEEQLAEVDEWFKACAERYPDVEYIDVVNEPLHVVHPCREALGGAGSTGWDWVVTSFEMARACFPKAKLLINEFDLVNMGENVVKYIEIIKPLQEKKLIDGVGIQAHWFSFAGMPPNVVRDNIDNLAKTNLPLYPSEFDLAGNDSVQLHDYKAYFPILWEHPAVVGVTLWGYIQGTTWKDSTWLIRSNGSERPALVWLRDYVSGKVKTITPYVIHDYRGRLGDNVARPDDVGLTVFDLFGRTVARYAAPMRCTSEKNRTAVGAPGMFIIRDSRGSASATAAPERMSMPRR
jgi:endo-1,4-beta-xylanase